jgi:predicted ATPase
VKCRRIYFQGYKRLAGAECDVSPHLIAFVGQNESGKSSVLNGLAWLTEVGQTPLAELDKCRSNRRDSGWIVGASFALSAEDLELLQPLGFKDVPRDLAAWKQADGSVVLSLRRPDKPVRDPAPFAAALAALQSLQARSPKMFEAVDDDEDDRPGQWLEDCAGALGDAEHQWLDSEVASATSLVEWLGEVPVGRKRPRGERQARLLQEASSFGSRPHPRDRAIELLRARMPRFVLFAEEDRELPTYSQIDDDNRGALKPAIRNILKIAGLDPAELWRAHAAEDTGEIETLIAAANAKLDLFFTQSWNQSNVAVRLKLDAGELQAHVYEIETTRYTRLEERSDGLRAFIALATFLGAQQLAVPPVLLIDEAETHLHFDAQADLVGVLLRQVNATQVFYSTHSPGCLPSDLGTGIRLLERSGATSAVKSHFWTNEEPGFAPLLFAMGAGAAAFSACRWAVVTEGASDMIMLPTLIRAATGLPDLPYQVAPGLSNAHKYGMRVEEVAARVVYLADGDGDGDRYIADLHASGVPPTRTFQLPRGMATEDLLNTGFYLETVGAMLKAGEPRPTSRALAKNVTIARALTTWAANNSPAVDVPGKVAVGYAVIESSNLTLKPMAVRALVALHTKFIAAFEGTIDRSTGEGSGQAGLAINPDAR